MDPRGSLGRGIDRALARLLDLGLIAHKPWEKGHIDGVWQILPVPVSQS